MTLPVDGYRLTDISPKAYEHPADRAATAALGQVPMLDVVVRKLIEMGYERALRQAYLGSAVRLGADQLPDVWNLHNQVYATLDMGDPPDLYVTQFPIANAAAIGAGKPIVVANSQLVQLLPAEGQRAVFAHEAAHILSDHTLYRTALLILLRMGAAIRMPLLTGLPLMAVRAALLEWSRAAELTCDRASALVCRDPLVVCRTLLTLAAGTAADDLDLDAFMSQATSYEEGGTGFDRFSRMLLDLNLTHPMPVRRVKHLMTWVQSGDYDRIVGGAYARRSDPVDARQDAGDAVTHYTERFQKLFQEISDASADAGKRMGDAVEQGGKKLSDWLHGPDEGNGDAPGA